MAIQMGRVVYDKPITYSKNVRIGKWVEENFKYEKKCLKHETTYNYEYQPKEYSARNESELWDNKFMGDGLHPRLIRDHEGTKYLENYSTTYDLSLNHFPKCMKGPVEKFWRFRMQTYEPEVDYTLNYGNITGYGLLDEKKEKWRCETMRTTPISLYEDSFLPPKLEDYKFKRHGTPIENSTNMVKQNGAMAALKLRGTLLFFLPEAEHMKQVVEEPTCNPITWDCPDALKTTVPARCHEQIERIVYPPPHYRPKIPFKCIMQKDK